jgi:hypothetical protein
MKGIKELTSEELRELYCAPENTDDPESIDFEDGPEGVEELSDGETL